MSQGDEILTSTLEFLARHSLPPVPLDPALIDGFIAALRRLPMFASQRLRLSIDIVSKPSEWYIAASTDPTAEIGRRHAVSEGLTGWALLTKRAAHLQVNRQHPMPIGVKFLPGYDKVRSAFLWVFRAVAEPIAALCVVSDEDDAVTDDLVLALRHASWHIKAALVGIHDEQAGGRGSARTTPSWLRAHAKIADDATATAWLRSLFQDKCPEYQHAYFWPWRCTTQRLEPLHFWKDEIPPHSWPGPLNRGQGFVGRCAETLEPVLENEVRNGRGQQTGIETPHAEMRPGVKLGSILAYPIKDPHRFHGVLAVVSEVPDQFHDNPKLAEIVELIAQGLQQNDNHRLDDLEAEVLKELQQSLVGPDIPSAFWKRLAKVLRMLEDDGLCTAAALYVGRRNQPNLFTCKGAGPHAADVCEPTINSDDDDVFEALLNSNPDGVRVTRRDVKRPPLKLALTEPTTQYWIKRDSSEARRPGHPSFLALATLPPSTVWQGAFGTRPVEPILSRIFSAVFVYARAVLKARDFERMGQERMNALSAATHNLRAPVAALHGQAESLSGLSPENEGTRREILRKADEAMLRIENVLYQWLIVREDGSRIEPKGDAEQVEPQLIVSDVVTKARALTLHNIQFDCDRSVQSGCFLLVSRFSLGLALTNVIENAVKFGKQSPVYVRLRFAPPDNGMSSPLKATIQVRDHGIGIPAENLKVIFKPGRMHAYSREFSVSGASMGLSITKAIIEGYGGKIWPESSLGPGKGAEFHITLPLYRR
jgi:signal transduction histidine kinase